MSESRDLVAPVETDLTGFDLVNKPMARRSHASSEAMNVVVGRMRTP
jgi:hypothetical protein